MSLLKQVKTERLPGHIAVIMDGNGRWARKRGALRVFGHNNAIESVRAVSEGCAELGIKYLTLFAFSTENWERPQEEVNSLMELLVKTLSSELKTLNKNNIRLHAIGDFTHLPEKCYKELQNSIDATAGNKQMVLTLALNYSGKWDIMQATRKMCEKVVKGEISSDDIKQENFDKYLSTFDVPDPELLIRTSGEMRISNFLLWQLAYSELYFTNTLWPDFRKEHLYEALINFQNRERRFGKTSEQIV